ncbi:hypothetical protein COB11_00565 [Candidatus Aerophobetes bacterium]|uniref:Uncharacterized protein n=1 Tax=Aerophobetes bacterium TaxID=2030807 RepID=A0A2A4YMP4_UNCAE|nr:MAG: hypothetical protein COB11_00565 [Candidatus Aerophobetes bacterium]
MSDAITIDNFPIETSVQWAEAQESLETKYISDSPYISTHTEITVVKPKHQSLDALFETHKKAPTWAHFIAPEGFHNQSNRFFTHTIIPNTHTDELLGRLEDMLEDIKKAQKKTQEEQYETLKGFFKVAVDLDKMLTEARSRVLQFRKG